MSRRRAETTQPFPSSERRNIGASYWAVGSGGGRRTEAVQGGCEVWGERDAVRPSGDADDLGSADDSGCGQGRRERGGGGQEPARTVNGRRRRDGGRGVDRHKAAGCEGGKRPGGGWTRGRRAVRHRAAPHQGAAVPHGAAAGHQAPVDLLVSETHGQFGTGARKGPGGSPRTAHLRLRPSRHGHPRGHREEQSQEKGDELVESVPHIYLKYTPERAERFRRRRCQRARRRPYSMLSTTACQLASMMLVETPTVLHVSPASA